MTHISSVFSYDNKPITEGDIVYQMGTRGNHDCYLIPMRVKNVYQHDQTLECLVQEHYGVENKVVLANKVHTDPLDLVDNWMQTANFQINRVLIPRLDALKKIQNDLKNGNKPNPPDDIEEI